MKNDQSNKKMKLSSSSPGSKEVIPNDLLDLPKSFRELPKDIILEIFCKLPVKSLCRFKCVSKSMQTMIQHPVFVDKARSKAPFKWAILDFDQCMLIVKADRNGFTKTQEIRYPNDVWEFRYCNGIVGFYLVGHDYNFCLSNITTGELIELQVEPPTDKSTMGEHFELGFDPSSKKHKVLFWRGSKHYPSECYVRTLEEGTSWRPVNNVPKVLGWRERSQEDRPQFCCANGTLFWFIGEKHIMVSFNVANEQFGTVELPQRLSHMVNEREFIYSIFEFEGGLCLVEQPCSDENRCSLEIVNLWMLKDIENSVWVTMLKDKMLPLEGTGLRNYYLGDSAITHPFEAIFFSQNGEISIATVDYDHKYIFLYNFLSGQFERIEIFGELGGIHHFRVNNYVENYLSLENLGWEIW